MSFSITGLTKVVKYIITDDGFIFYDKHGSIPDPQNAYWNGDLYLYHYDGKSLKGLPGAVNGALNLNTYEGKSLEGLPDIVYGDLDLRSYNGKTLEGMSKIMRGILGLDSYKGNDFSNLPKEYFGLYVYDQWYTKDQFDDYWKTKRLKRALLD